MVNHLKVFLEASKVQAIKLFLKKVGKHVNRWSKMAEMRLNFEAIESGLGS